MKDVVDRLTPLAVMLLALLGEGDMHPYEMKRLMLQRRDDRLVPVTSGTMYHTVARLQRWGLVTEVGVDRDGNRPERTTYTLTDTGREAVLDWVRRELPRIDNHAEFRVALAEAHTLERDEVLELMARRRDALDLVASQISEGLAGAHAKGVPGQYLIEVDRERALAACDLEWTTALIAQISDGTLAWGNLPITDNYLDQRKAARQ